MRSDRKQTKRVQLASVQPYHSGSGAANYAFRGFKSNKYFTSDRTIPLDIYFRRPDGKPLCGFGFEIEVQCFTIDDSDVLAEILDKVVFSHFPADLFKMQADCSLNGAKSSAECITQVMTKEAVRNNYANFKLMFDTYFKKCGISASRTGACGMHINMSNALFGKTVEKQKDNIRKLLYLVNHFYTLFCNLTARDLRHTAYCRQMTNYTTQAACKAFDLENAPSSHGICCNFSHFTEGRVELRVVGGQSSFACFRNTCESIFHVIHAVNTLKWSDLDDLSKVFAGCNQYVYDRLNTKCREAGTISASDLEKIEATIKTETLL